MGLLLAGVAATAAIVCAVLIRLLRPLLARYALARPNARSSHTVPTPQGGGIAVVAAALGAWFAGLWTTGVVLPPLVWIVAAGAVALALVGAADDIRPLRVRTRLFVQAACIAAVLGWGGVEDVLPEAVPVWLAGPILLLAGLWWVNLVNFMDGIDWMTLSGLLPLCGALAFIGLGPEAGLAPTVLVAALTGGLVAFAPANRPVARLFLGDVGSLPLGLLTGWALLELARAGHLAAALLLPLYYLADATVTLARRLARRERVSEAHRSHYYQRALDGGYRVIDVTARVFALNLLLAVLAAATTVWPKPVVAAGAFALGAGLVAMTLRSFARGRWTGGPARVQGRAGQDRARP